MTSAARLGDSARPLAVAYDVALLDLDGVVYVGAAAVPGAVGHLDAARELGQQRCFVTNNAARPPGVVADHLRELGVRVDDADVVTSAQAAARLVAEQVPARARVLVVGGVGLVEALAEHDLVAVDSADADPAAVVQGFHPSVGWQLLAEGAYAVAAGLPWVASNDDRTVPTARGIAPGNGTLVAAIATATGRAPAVAGKPERALIEESVLRTGAHDPLLVGDRLDTDISGARRYPMPSLLVLTGVTTMHQLLTATGDERPDFVAGDLGGLLMAHPEVRIDVTREPSTTVGAGAVVTASCAGWTARACAGVLSLHRDGADTDHTAAEAAGLAALRAVVAASWRAHDTDAGADDLDDSAVVAQLREMIA